MYFKIDAYIKQNKYRNKHKKNFQHKRLKIKKKR